MQKAAAEKANQPYRSLYRAEPGALERELQRPWTAL